jgi:hypothetical protein
MHMALAELGGVTTRSEGEGDDRHMLIVPDPSRGGAAPGPAAPSQGVADES